MYLVLELYTCIHDADEFPLVLPEQVNQIDNYLNIWFAYFPPVPDLLKYFLLGV